MILKSLSLFLCFFIALVSGEEFEMLKGRYRRSFDNLTLNSELSFDEAQKNFILNEHNRHRRNAGSSNMLLMSWDPNLADIAQEHSNKCVFEHSDNPFGENLAIDSRSFSTVAQSFVNLWHNEISDYDYENIVCAPGKVCGHYTQIVWASTYLVGCGVANCLGVEDNVEYHLVTCNYDPAGNIHNNAGPLPPYQRGIGCSACADPADTCDNGLCSNPSRNVLTTTSTASTSSSTDSTLTSTSASTLSTTDPTSTSTSTLSTTTPTSTSASTIPTTTPTSPSASTLSTTIRTSTSADTHSSTTSTSPITHSTSTPTISTTPSSSTHSTTTRTESTSTPLSSSTSGPGTSTSFSSTSAPAEECQHQQEYLQILRDYRETLREWKEANNC